MIPPRLPPPSIIMRFQMLTWVVGWCDGAGSTSSAGRPTIWIRVGQGPTYLSVGAGVVWTFLLSSIISLFFLPLSGRRPDID